MYQDDPASVKLIDQQIDQLKSSISVSEVARGAAGAISDTDKALAALVLGVPTRAVMGAGTGELLERTALTQAGKEASAAGAAINASVDPRKFSDYIFKPGADHGKNSVFETLGYTADDSKFLSTMWQEQATNKYAAKEFTLGKADQYGQRIDIEIALPGKGASAGQTSYLRSGWMIQPDGSLKLNTPFSGFTK